jgi:hypothetical protein
VTKKAYSQSKPWFYLGFKWGVKFWFLQPNHNFKPIYHELLNIFSC